MDLNNMYIHKNDDGMLVIACIMSCANYLIAFTVDAFITIM